MAIAAGAAGRAADAGHACGRRDSGGRQADPRRSGPVASQEAIKQIGTNGGGFFNANSSPPVREPDAADQLHRHGRDERAGLRLRGRLRRSSPARGRRRTPSWPSWSSCSSERPQPPSTSPKPSPCPALQHALHVTPMAEHGGQGGPLRRRRQRRVLSAMTTGASCGAVNAMHESYTPLGGGDGAVHDPAGRDPPRRRGFGPLRHRGDGAVQRLHRRAHGRPHARIPRQEGRGAGGEAGAPGRTDPAAVHLGLHGDRRGAARGAERPGGARRHPARDERDPLRLLVGGGE